MTEKEPQTKHFVCYYKTDLRLKELKNSGRLTHVIKKPLYSDEKLTNQIGFGKATIEYISLQPNVLATTETAFFIKKNIFTCSYVKNNNEEIETLITYSNINSKKDAYLGKITREILSDGLTRKVTITAIQK